MKRATRLWLQRWAHDPANDYWSEEAQDVLDSDARQRAEIRDLKARLKHLRSAGPHLGYLYPAEFWAVLDLKSRKWRK